MASETKRNEMLATQQEKPNHYTYLKEFRVEQCQSFLQHKCNQHRPFICFNWHFQNQRRRRPIRKRDGTFNYSADNYCTKYDETTGICPDGDDCPFLHRTAGDTERRYHLRYYKTCMCVHDTDSRGYCVKNGHHCAFAHGIQDQRPPVYDIKELETLSNAEIALDGTNAQNALDKERNLMNEDPKWQDTNYVLANYKTEPCKRPPRLCRQGYACPQYHNSKDKRRSPRKFKYRSTPCPNVKHGEEWGEPGNCEAGDNCQYCHTRTEQQFHPEIYKSTKCNDVQQAGYCPRSVFCAFAHVEPYIVTEEKPHDLESGGFSTDLTDLVKNALQDFKSKDASNKTGLISIANNLQEANDNLQSQQQQQKQNPTNTTGRISPSISTAVTTNTTISNKAPGAHLVNKSNLNVINQNHLITTKADILQQQQQQQHYNYLIRKFHLNNFNNKTNNNNSNSDNISSDSVDDILASVAILQQQQQQQQNLTNGNIMTTTTAIGGGVAQTLTSPVTTTTTAAATAAAVATTKRIFSQAKQQMAADILKLLNIDGNETNNILLNALDKSSNQGKFINFSLPLDRLSCSMDDPRENSLTASLANSSLLTRSSAPINIPNSTLNNSLNDFSSGGFAVNIPSSLTYSPTNHTSLFGVSDAFNYSGSNSNKLSNSLSAATQNDGNNLFFPSRIISPGFTDGLSISPVVRRSELNSIRDDMNSSSLGNSLFENSLTTTKNAFSLQSLQSQNNSDVGLLTNELLKLSDRFDETARKLIATEIQRDKAKQESFEWKERYDIAQTQLNLSAELRNLSIQKLKQLQSKLRSDLEDVEKVLYLENAKKCMKCEENNRSVTLEPCNHFILCSTCACSVTECPYCQTRVERTHT